MSEPNYIAIEGVIGAGKSTLAKMLAVKLEAEPLLDDAMNNPFIVDFYKDRKRYAFSAQLFFLLTRYQQQQALIERDLFAQNITTPQAPSPAAKVSQTIGLSKVTITYSRPAAKGREIWGTHR